MGNTIFSQNTKEHEGKVLSHFEDTNGDRLSHLDMCEEIVIVFMDETKIRLSLDWYGRDCYISQRDIKDKHYV